MAGGAGMPLLVSRVKKCVTSGEETYRFPLIPSLVRCVLGEALTESIANELPQKSECNRVLSFLLGDDI